MLKSNTRPIQPLYNRIVFYNNDLLKSGKKIEVKDIYCPLPFNHMNWHPNGNISVCCVAEMFPPNDGFYRNNLRQMSNLKKDSIKEIWANFDTEKAHRLLFTRDYAR